MPSPFDAEAAKCRVAQAEWSRLDVRLRLRSIRALRSLLVERADALLAAVNADIGRSEIEVVATELLPTAAALKFLEREAVQLLKPRRISRWQCPLWLFGCRDAVHRRPWGVVGVIGTWNYPIFLNAVQIAQALVAGNGVLWKPSENSLRSSELLVELFYAAGFPRELLQLLPATRDAGPQLVEAEIDHIVFTGSDVVGRKLASRLGERLIPSTLELSGCDSMFVLADANVDLAARAAWFGVTLNRGQTCIAVRRVFVARERYAEFVEKMKPLVENAKPLSLVLKGQIEQAEHFIENAIANGAHALPRSRDAESSERSAGAIVPTFLLDATPDMAICQEACFAPLAAVFPFDSIDDALSKSAACPFGLASSIFTADIPTASALAARIPAGAVTINDVLAPTAHPATPFGGRGASGWGMTQGVEGLLAMTTPQTVTVRSGSFRPHIDESANPDPVTLDVMRGLLRMTHSRGFRDRLRGLRQMLGGIRHKRK